MSSIPLYSFSLLLSSLLISGTMMTVKVSADQSFIRTSCSHTLYADLCYSSLSRYASQVGNDPVMLARFAMNVTIGCLKPLSKYIDSVLHQTNTSSSSDVPPLKDCNELIRDAIDLVKKSEKEVTGLETMVGTSEMKRRIGNSQTWLSAVITNEVTCADGLGDACGNTGGDVEQEVCRKVTRTKQLTSISLAITNSLANHDK